MRVSLVVGAIARYPVKSCRGQALAEAVVEPWGLAGDRRWMLVDAEGGFVTARKHPRLLLVTPRPEADGLTISAPGAPELRVRPPDGPLVEVGIWRDRVKATPAGDAAHAWFSRHLGFPVSLVYLDDPSRRPTAKAYGLATDVVSFADGFPLLLTSTASLDALNELIVAGPHASEAPLPMARFRPNLVVDGAQPWAEDGWRRIRVGDGPGAARFRVVKSCGRCVLTTIDPQTAVKGREPLVTLGRHRRGTHGVLFGMNLAPDTPGAVIRVGDPVSVEPG